MVSKPYWWIVVIGLIVIMFFWASNLSAQYDEHYKVITANNLFRPLGWKPPDRTPKFELIGTWINLKKDVKIAYVRDIKSNQISRLGVGSNFNGDIVLHIKSNSMEMTKGELYELPSISFLNTNRGNRNSKRRSSTSMQRESSSKTREKGNGGDNSNTLQGDTQSIRQRWRNASSEERVRMIDEFRKLGGNRRRNRRGR